MLWLKVRKTNFIVQFLMFFSEMFKVRCGVNRFFLRLGAKKRKKAFLFLMFF